MSEAKTLLQMAGADPKPAPLGDCVLVMIDCQREYLDGGLKLHRVEEALAEGALLLALARDRGVPVVHIQHNGNPGGLFDPEGPKHTLCDQVKPLDGEMVVTKTKPNAFAGTKLEEVLKPFARKNLIVAGLMTHMCVSSTVRSALDHNYGCTVVAGACATRDLPDSLGGDGVIKAADLHRAALAGLSDRFAVIVPDALSLEGN
ncbi:MAG: cysteine hydrolase [Rhodospirillales bacterium]|nr:cysteine hydrolase [Rhodospirillales bacterium]